MSTIRVPAGIDKSWEQKRKDIKSFFSIFGKSDIKPHPKSSSQDVSVLSRIETTYLENTTDLEKLELKCKHKRRSISNTRMPSFNRRENISSPNGDDIKLKLMLEQQLKECVNELGLAKHYISTLTEENLRLNLYVELLEQKPLRAMTNLDSDLKRLRSQHTSLEEDNKLLVYEVQKLESLISECSFCSNSMSHGKQIKLGSEIDDSMVSKVIEELHERQAQCNRIINKNKFNNSEESEVVRSKNLFPLDVNDLAAIKSSFNMQNDHSVYSQNISNNNLNISPFPHYKNHDDDVFNSNAIKPPINVTNDNKAPHVYSNSLDSNCNNYKENKPLRNMTSTPIGETKFRPIMSYNRSREARSVSKYYNKRDINKNIKQIAIDSSGEIKGTFNAASYKEHINAIDNEPMISSICQIVKPLPMRLNQQQKGANIQCRSTNNLHNYNNSLSDVTRPLCSKKENDNEYSNINQFKIGNKTDRESVITCSSPLPNSEYNVVPEIPKKRGELDSNSIDIFERNKFRSKSLSSRITNKLANKERDVALSQATKNSGNKLRDVNKIPLICDANLNLPVYNKNINSFDNCTGDKMMVEPTCVNTSNVVNYNNDTDNIEVKYDGSTPLNLSYIDGNKLSGNKENLDISNAENLSLNSFGSINKLIINNSIFNDYICKNLKANHSELNCDFDSIKLNALINEFNNSFNNDIDCKNLNDFYNIITNKIENAAFLNMLYYLRSRSLISLSSFSQLNNGNTTSQTSGSDNTENDKCIDDERYKEGHRDNINHKGAILNKSNECLSDSSFVNSSGFSPLEVIPSFNSNLNNYGHNINRNNMVELEIGNNHNTGYNNTGYNNTGSCENNVLDLSVNLREDSKNNNSESVKGLNQSVGNNILEKRLINNNIELNQTSKIIGAEVEPSVENIWVMR